ncbi:MAG: biotin carboxylase N-terminal domain-containing protein [Vicinamibacterales bacterium]
MFTRVLVANRGEIAVRVIRACRERGLATVAVYSDADAKAQHTLAADDAVRIGPAQAAESYLSIPAIIAAAKATRADAIHPGYGFLSEHPDFPRACVEHGIVFIGPGADAMEAMGSKIGARTLATRAGVPVVPGMTPSDQSDDSIAATAREVGLPVLLKPSEGGGGIGMKAVRHDSDLVEAIAQARREAVGAFGDGTLYVERLVEHARHIEVQVLADAHGHLVYVFERECSVQRRHQKVLEESPSPVVSPGLRRHMGEAAVALARTAGYLNAGTVEFLVEGEGDAARFYFLEMNTRLQVEHPVTEQVTGIDLVHAQLSIAAGEPLPWSQDALSQRGHAIEARVYAEDPESGYLPQAGRLLLYREPVMPGVRIDSGVAEGDEVSVHYDPMLAKVIASASSRDMARRRLVEALACFPILGIRTNVPFLISLLNHPRFVSADVDTRWLDSDGEALRAAEAREPDDLVRSIAAASRTTAGHRAGSGAVADPWDTLRGVRV